MRRLISRSAWRQLLVVVVAIVVFVLLYEIRMFDSTYATWTSMLSEGQAPAAGERLNFSATAYCKGTMTASGVSPKTGVAAADPTLLPVGSVINVAAGDAKYSGVYTVMDTGPKVQGRILDLYMWNCHEALRFGRKEVEITVLRLGWNPQASSPGLIQRLFRRREAARQIPPPGPPPPAGVPPEEPPPDPGAATPPEPGVTPQTGVIVGSQ
jgi:3D (Asp-Asp-Asp) domain-containing protein